MLQYLYNLLAANIADGRNLDPGIISAMDAMLRVERQSLRDADATFAGTWSFSNYKVLAKVRV